MLGIEEAEFERIQKMSNVDLHKEVIKHWFDIGNASWSELVRQLCDNLVNKQGVAQKIAQDHRELLCIVMIVILPMNHNVLAIVMLFIKVRACIYNVTIIY